MWVLAPVLALPVTLDKALLMSSQSCQKPREPWESNGMNGCERAPHTSLVCYKETGVWLIIIPVVVGLGTKRIGPWAFFSMISQGHLQK